jgi:chaperonin GroES
MIKPVGYRILVQREDKKERTDSGLYLPETSKEKPNVGKVIALGSEGDKKYDMSVGERVMFSKYDGVEVTDEGTDYVLLSADSVLAIIK